MTTSLIINSPYKCPLAHWKFADGESDKQQPQRIERRRKAGYTIADPKAKPHQDKGIFVELPLVNKIRLRVDAWRQKGYPGITGITKALLEHWKDREQEEHPLFFCQIEAIETLIWIIETADSEKTGIEIPTDGGTFDRLCCKLATGTGKTVVMAMLIAWQTINRVTYQKDNRFSQNFFIVAPNLTVRERLAVLHPAAQNNYYDEFNIVPPSMWGRLRQAGVIIRNWQAFSWETDEQIKKKKGVDQRGAKSDEAYTREVLSELANARQLVVINDEAHHAWRITDKQSGISKEQKEEATKWIGGLDRIHKTRGILNCFDFSATPFIPSGKTTEESLFGWIVSDFGLSESIESGLVKTPRTVVRDDAIPDARTYKSRLYHIYNDPEVKDDLNQRAKPNMPLPNLIINAYALLGVDWEQTKERWAGSETPPVMITVANRTETAARIKYAFSHQSILKEIGTLHEPAGMLHIDSKVLKDAEGKDLASQTTQMVNGNEDSNEENGARPVTKKEQAERLRRQVNTVGQKGEPGANIQNVISVGMLSEGWDARTVTHIMGLRAFTSQLLCEQVIGRGLRRASYEINRETNLFDAEYVNVFGVPFSFLPHEETGDKSPPPPDPKITIRPVEEKADFAIRWPNVIRIDRTYKPRLSVDWNKVAPLKLDTADTVKIVELAPTVDGKPDVSKIKDIDLEKLVEQYRRQTRIFEAAQAVWQDMQPGWSAPPGLVMAELVRLAEQFIDSDRITVMPALFNRDQKRRQLAIIFNISKVIQHFWQAISFHNTESTSLVLDSNYPIRSTLDMSPWRTGKPCGYAKKSHINYCVYDSTWESSEAFELDRNDAVEAWVKNDHLGFDVLYVHNGVVRKYRPDFLIRLTSGSYLVLEVKGRQTDQDNAKHIYMKKWVEAVSQEGGFGQWQFAVSEKPSDIKDIIEKFSRSR